MHTKEQLARVIDHTNLDPGATRGELERLATEANRHGFASVCVYPTDVPRIVDRVDVNVCAVVGFPHGKSPTTVKAMEAQEAVEQGANEVDMVINQTALKDGAYQNVVADVQAVREAVAEATLKVITENCNLDPGEQKVACRAAAEGGADFVKTSTGFGAHGARVEDVQRMAAALDDVDRDIGIKVAGGIKRAEEALRLWAASDRAMEPDTFRIGASSGPAILEGVDG